MTEAGLRRTVRAEPSTTAGTLRRLRVVLVGGCVLCGALCVLAFTGAHRTVDLGLERSAQAVLQADAVAAALADADRTAAEGIRSGTAALGGNAGQYDNDIAAVHQGLELIAEHRTSEDEEAERKLELVNGLVVSYTAQIQQAHADLQQDHRSLSLVYLRNASALLHQDDGILANLSELRGLEERVLQRQRSSVWAAGATSLLWLLPVVALAALLVRTDVLVRRRFRRRLNAGLLAAFAALLVMAGTAALSLLSNAQFDEALDGPYAEVRTAGLREAANTDGDGRNEIAALARELCGRARDCAPEILDGTFLPPSLGAPPSEARAGDAPKALRDAQRKGLEEFGRESGAAGAAFGVRVALIVAMAALASAAIAFGLRPRINEYRFRRS
ncbi:MULTISPECIES: hypothetical protein [Actinomadura]|uniref:Integral membrane protein n=1 Tax=Actinomadura yumaensis TaxID=111807 RepID=A0ABW2CQZ3_9ACTN|nr:hypothetical protein [Actinomadura sp. J1-007]MWK37322.1 hypothetical protein [Actinomadura sp. J1-007]